MIDSRAFDDAVILDEVELTINVDGQEIMLYTSQNFELKEDREVEVRSGPGRKKRRKRKLRKDAQYSWTMTLDEPNAALLQNPDDFQENAGETSGFVINGVTYTSLMDLPAFTIVARNPRQDGSTIVRRVKGCEFNENSGSYGIGEAASRSVGGVATAIEGFI